MIKKHSGRSLPSINTNPSSEDDWMAEFSKNLDKQSTRSKGKANSVYDQISAIMGNKSKYPTVEAAVEDMKERSGMTKFLDKMKSESQSSGGNTKKADCESCEKGVKLFQDVPQVKNTIDNYCDDTHGNLPLPAIVEKVRSIHRNDVSSDADWNADDLLHYINSKNTESKKKHPGDESNFQNLGRQPRSNNDDIDPSNLDAFHALTPASIK